MAGIRIANLYKKTTKDGKMMLTGNWGNARMTIFVNSYKNKPEDCDYVAYIDAKPKPQNQGHPYSPQNNPPPPQQKSFQEKQWPSPQPKNEYVDHTKRQYQPPNQQQDAPPVDDAPWPEEPPF
jgi:hypothetical protein